MPDDCLHAAGQELPVRVVHACLLHTGPDATHDNPAAEPAH